jgi:hypothetical protein
MDLGFDTAGLAALCNAERLMVDRWGPNVGRTVGRRLLDLAAVTAETIERMPTATVARGKAGATTITFAGAIVISGVITTAGTGAAGTATDAGQFVISSIEVQEGRR